MVSTTLTAPAGVCARAGSTPGSRWRLLLACMRAQAAPWFTLHLPRYLAVMQGPHCADGCCCWRLRARRQHPWFTLHLPRYLAVMQADTLASAALVDDDIVAEVVRLGFRRAEVLDAIQKRVQNKARARAPAAVPPAAPAALLAAPAGFARGSCCSARCPCCSRSLPPALLCSAVPAVWLTVPAAALFTPGLLDHIAPRA